MREHEAVSKICIVNKYLITRRERLCGGQITRSQVENSKCVLTRVCSSWRGEREVSRSAVFILLHVMAHKLITKFCDTPRNTFFFADLIKKQQGILLFIHTDSYCCHCFN